MAEIAASMVMDLRQRTGLGMMECKKALTEAAGDLAKAEELLRIKSGAKASKAAGRIAAEGVIGLYVAPDAKSAAMVEVNCETDFVAKNDDFRAFAAEIAQIVARDNPADVAALGARTARLRRDRRGPPHGARAEDRREPVDSPLRAQSRHRPDRVLRPRQQDRRAGGLTGGQDDAGKDLAMHVAASKPVAVSATKRAGRVVAKERAICRRTAADSRQAGEHRRQDGRWARRQVPGRGHACSAQPFVKGRRQADGGRAREGAGRGRQRLRRSSSSARASRRRRTISRPKWRR